jgi:SAM-dependent methyltransferase
MERQNAVDYWTERARTVPAALAVHPQDRWKRYHGWTRRLLQDWTLQRIKEVKPRFRRGLDLGCGYGDWAAMFAPLCDEIYACDLAPEFAAQACVRLAQHRAAYVECADIRRYEVPRQLDLIYVGSVLLYIDDAEALDVLRRLRAAAVPDALLVIRDYCTFNIGRPARTETSMHREPSRLRDLAELAGFRSVEMRSSPSIYGQQMAGDARWLRWPLRAAWRAATIMWQRASYTLVFSG